MNKQHNDQDDQQAQASGGAKKGGSSGRRSRRHNKPSQRDGQGAQPQTASTSASSEATGPAAAATAESKPASDASVSAAPAGNASSDASGENKASGTPSDKPGEKTPGASSAAPAAPAAKPTSTSTSTSTSTTKPAASAKNAPSKGAPGKNATGGSGAGGPGGSGSGGSGAGRPPAEQSSNGGRVGVVALVVAIVLGAGGAYFGWQLWQKLEAHDQALATLPDAPVSQSSLDSLGSQLESQLQSGEQQRDQAMESAIDELRGEFSDYRSSVDDTLDKVLTQLSQEQDTDERDWLHAEAAYLLRLANQRLQLERDVDGAAALLRTADKRLLEADNPALMPVRREIASELAAIESVPSVDRSGLYLALNAQQERVSALPLSQDIEEMVADARIEEAPSGGWQSQMSTFGNELKSLVTVRKHDEALEALISPEQESYLRQSLRLVLEQSQLALLKEEQDLYDASLDKALTLIDGYYDTDDAGVKAVIERLEQLKGEEIHPELPDISASQQALNRFIQQRFEAGSGGQGDDA